MAFLAKELLLIFGVYDPNLELLNRVLAFTLNNIGCYYKKISKSNSSLKYLEKALEIVSKLDSQRKHLEIKASIFLNLSSVHSLRSKHDIALDYCSKAISILTDLYNKLRFSGNKNSEVTNEKTNIDANQPYADLTDTSSELITNKKESKLDLIKYNSEDENLITSLIIAYFNLGIEFEFMNEKQESMRYLKLAYDISFRELGPASFLTNTLSAKINKEISSTNPSEVDKPILEEDEIKETRRENKRSKRRRKLNARSRKQLNLSSIECGSITQFKGNFDSITDQNPLNKNSLIQ